MFRDTKIIIKKVSSPSLVIFYIVCLLIIDQNIRCIYVGLTNYTPIIKILIKIFRILIVLENRNIWMGYQYKTSCIKIYYIKVNFYSEMEWKYEVKEKNGVNNSLVMYFLKISF